jgi:chromatin segregation and condensation protein Rec8/ScpA/Scc1 (kleisin family)
MSLDSLLGLYRKFLNTESNQPDIEIDDHFENLIEEQRDYINGFFDQRTGQWFRMDALFQNRRELRIVIATFLVLLDMVFRDLLKMKEEDGLVYLLKNE